MVKDRIEIAILGGGESGTGAAALAKKTSHRVLVSDSGIIREKYKNVLLNLDIRFEEGRHSQSSILGAELIVKSPGIPDTIPVIVEAEKKGIPIWSEIEFAGRFTAGKKICITGSNGKTTTTLLAHHILKKAGLDVSLAGNIGRSFAGELARGDHDLWVLEISSFQLDRMYGFRADTAVLLNITPDHLDRYGHNFDSYARSKFRIARNQAAGDFFIYNRDDTTIERLLNESGIGSNRIPFSIREEIPADGAYLRENEMIIQYDSKQIKMTLEDLALQGKHNLYNSMAAGITARLLDIRKDIIKESLSDFQNVEHRLEYVTTIHGVEFINDSKATNVNSTWYALESIKRPVIWIAGGIDKGNDYSTISELVRQKVKAIICLGVDNSLIRKEFSGAVENIFETRSVSEAVKIAYHLGKRGDSVLLSPACASFDLFENFEDRGNQFKKAVNNL